MPRTSKTIQALAVFAAGLLAGVACMAWLVVKDYRPPVEGATITPGKLASACSSVGADASVDMAICLGFISGVLNSSPDIARLCLPVSWSAAAGQRLFVAWAKRHPEDLGVSAAEGVVLAHQGSFACHGGERNGV